LQNLSTFLKISQTSHVNRIQINEKSTIVYSYKVDNKMGIKDIIALQFNMSDKKLAQRIKDTILLTEANPPNKR